MISLAILALFAVAITAMMHAATLIDAANTAARQAKHRAKIAEAAGERERQWQFVAGKVWGR